MTTEPDGIRIIPSCDFGINPGELLRLEDLRISVRVEEDGIQLYRSMSLSPTTVWKPGCDHLFFLGEPLLEGMSNPAGEVLFTLPPRPATTMETRIRQSPGKTGIRFMGADLKLAPLAGNPSDYRFRLEILHRVDLPPANDTDGVRSLKIPLAHYAGYTPSNTVSVQIQLTLHEPWFFHGATLPETGALENRFDWELSVLPDQDLVLLFSDESPPEETGDPAPSRMETFLRILILAAILFALLGFLLFSVKARFKKKTSPPPSQ